MGELLGAGAPMLDSLAITAEVAGNKCYQRLWESVYVAVKQGRKIAGSLAGQSLMPPPVVQMISAGEESGTLAEVMHDIAEYYDGELRSRIKAATAMIEPMMIVAMGLMVGFIALSIILPIFKLSRTVQ